MNILTLLLVVSGVLLSSIAQLFLKAGTKSLGTLFHQTEGLNSVLRIATQPYIMSGIALYILSMGVWIVVLSKLPVSVAYPLLSIGYVVTAIFGYFLFGESISIAKIVGITVIIIGVVILTSTVN